MSIDSREITRLTGLGDNVFEAVDTVHSIKNIVTCHCPLYGGLYIFTIAAILFHLANPPLL